MATERARSQILLRGIPTARSGDEIAVGAYARRVRRRRVLIGAIGATLIVGAVGVYLALVPRSELPPTETYPVKVRCTACAFVGEVRVPHKQTFPMFCPKCGQKGCRQLWRCYSCGREFPGEAGAEPLRCPNCGKSSVGSAVPALTEAPVGRP